MQRAKFNSGPSTGASQSVNNTMGKQSTAKSTTKPVKDKRAALPVLTQSSSKPGAATKRAPQIEDPNAGHVAKTKRSKGKIGAHGSDRPNSSKMAQIYVRQVTPLDKIGTDGLVSNSAAPYGMGRSALERLGARAGVSSISTRAKGALLALLTPWMDDIVLESMMVARADGLRTIQSAHVMLAAEAHGVPLQC